MRARCIRQVILAAALMLLMSPAMAAIAPPKGPVLLKVTGNIHHTNVGGELWLDREMLKELPWHTIVTDTPWHRKPSRFEGPLLRSVLEMAGAESDMVEIHALNDFFAELPVSDTENYDVILAMKRNGEQMTIRHFGPLFVLYPFDDHPELKNEAIQFRSVWQVNQIKVL
ncbi:molybdopterin-dependent oxidoreductase [Halomonas huangheensis]|uniref:Oxidoreductase molybdopterin-binding domain-containing protein n=1 Tax=Halomonas huangheensis TaxID=1178482 RepID=W1NAB1_9GAMM|nr:molybdopterin-dependent oxidoreductase [Halomonas huangheensis]ALM53481.1 oxidoreductase [Halomonas huangheensis]ERL51840.1 hypothetical protein BJB45_11790 [Halomonas huangheensis]